LNFAKKFKKNADGKYTATKGFSFEKLMYYLLKKLKTMKKLQLKALALGAAEVLTRAQLRNVLGGVNAPGPGDCPTGCSNLNPCPVNSPYCLSTTCTDNNGTHFINQCSPTLPGQ
jgi:hypothetical protein